MSKKNISKRLWLLGWISLFTDFASEMLYPVMPLYLKEIGFSMLGIGFLEGMAEAIAGLTKGYFGAWSDRTGKRSPFIQLGYSLSALSKPLMAVLQTPFWIFSVRSADRLGKGIRTGARDALLAEEATPETKGRVFGFHRSMDTIGAFAGPLIALLYLYFYPADYRNLFLWAFIPGVIAILLTFLLKDKIIRVAKNKTSNLKTWLLFFKTAPLAYKQFVIAMVLFALFNSSDIFLLLKMKESGLSDTLLILFYIGYNALYALLAYPFGIYSDKIGLKKMLAAGLLFFAIAYGCMSFAENIFAFVIVFIFYGMYAAATDGISKAYITQLCNSENNATSIGSFAGFQSLAALAASTIAGFLWMQFGSSLVFVCSSLISFLVAAFIYFRIKS